MVGLGRLELQTYGLGNPLSSKIAAIIACVYADSGKSCTRLVPIGVILGTDREAAMQTGSIKKHGKWWTLKYRTNVLVNGVAQRKDVYKKLARVDRDHQPKPDGSAPEKVKALANLELAPLNAGQAQVYSGDTVDSFLLAFLKKGEGGRGRALNNTTKLSYKTMYRLAKDFLPKIELRQVRTPHIDKLLRDIAAADGADRRAQSVYANLKNFLSSAFRYAVRHGLVDSNPVRDVAIPQGNPSDTHAYTLKEVYQYMHVLTDHTSRALVMVAMFTGLRTEEIKGLRWEDYDGEVLNIRRAVAHGKLLTVKTDASQAPVPVIGVVKKVLADHLKLNSGDGYIFHGDTGNPLVIENLVRRSIIPTLSKANVDWHGFHAFRRGLGTYLEVNLKLSREFVKRILRHSTTDVTGRHYIKTDVEQNRKELERVEKDFLKLKPKLKL
jgi:integrase